MVSSRSRLQQFRQAAQRTLGPALSRTVALGVALAIGHGLGRVMTTLVDPNPAGLVSRTVNRVMEPLFQDTPEGYGPAPITTQGSPRGILNGLDRLEEALADQERAVPQLPGAVALGDSAVRLAVPAPRADTTEVGDVFTVPESASPEAHAGVIPGLAHSSYADSLRLVLGWPAPGLESGLAVDGQHADEPDGRRIVGGYVPARDQLVLDPTVTQARSLRLGLAHELMHRAQAIVGADIGPWWAAHVPQLPAEGSYARNNVLDHQAEAAAGAVEWLAVTARPPEADTAAARRSRVAHALRLQTLERTVPGTILMVRTLLSHPLYARHPLRTGELVLDGTRPLEAGILRVPDAPRLTLTPLAPPWTWAQLQGRPAGGVVSVVQQGLATSAGRPAMRALSRRVAGALAGGPPARQGH